MELDSLYIPLIKLPIDLISTDFSVCNISWNCDRAKLMMDTYDSLGQVHRGP